MRLVAGGEGEGAGEVHHVKAHLWVGLDGPGVVGARWSAASREMVAEKSGGDRRRLCCGGGLGVWRSLGGARDSGSTKGGVSAGGVVAEVRGGDVLGVLGRERARQGGESETKLLLVLKRARVGELRLYSELSTATVRWRPRSSSGWRGEGRRGPAQGGVGPEGCRGAAGGGGRSRRWPAASHGGGQRRLVPAAVKQRRREVEEDCWVFLQIPKSSGIPL